MSKPKRNKTLMYAIIFFIVLLILDQISKEVIIKNGVDIIIVPNILEFQLIRNTGGAFGVAEGNTGMFIITNLVVLGLIIRFIYLQKDFMDTVTLYSLCAILAGGFGNLIDRLIKGFVVDFVNLFPSIGLPKFNLADVYITIGWVILAFVFAKYTYKEIQNSQKQNSKDINNI